MSSLEIGVTGNIFTTFLTRNFDDGRIIFKFWYHFRRFQDRFTLCRHHQKSPRTHCLGYIKKIDKKLFGHNFCSRGRRKKLSKHFLSYMILYKMIKKKWGVWWLSYNKNIFILYDFCIFYSIFTVIRVLNCIFMVD